MSMDDAETGGMITDRYESDLVNVSMLALAEVLAADESPLARALARLQAEAARRDDVVAGHGSALAVEP